MPDDATGIDQGTQQTPPATSPAAPPSITSIDQIPQELRNQIEANHRRGLQTRLNDQQAKIEQLTNLHEQSRAFMDLAEANGITFEEGTELGEVGSQLMGTLSNLQTEQEKLTKANELKAQQLKEALEQSASLQSELNNTLTLHALQAHLGQNEDGKPRCVSSKAAELIAKELAAKAVHGDDGKFSGTFSMEVVDKESGVTETKPVDAKTAVGLLEANADWKHFFTATVNSGAGGDVVDGVKRAGDGNIDFNELVKNPAKFMEIMEKNPRMIDDAIAKLPTG